jgi:predicted AAA+ superfamily ATPase
MVKRNEFENAVRTALRRSPIAALLGPRQCGKTTLARMIAQTEGATYFDLEYQPDLARLADPMLALEPLRGLAVIDEIQRQPSLFPLLRVLADRNPLPTRFLILGSASPSLIKETSESLAGRVEFVELGGFDMWEAGVDSREELWVRGGFPRSFLADSDDDSLAWRENFVQTFLERDIPQLGVSVPAEAMRRFWTMVAHSHGQPWNASDIGRSMGLSDRAIRHYLDVLSGTFMVRQLQPWHENLAKRQVKSPKVYLRDSGILHSLLGLQDRHALLGHPKLGASWEGFMLEQTLRLLKPSQAYFWATHQGAELDLLLFMGGRRYGVEFKWSDAPRMTKSMHIALSDLGLAHLWVVYPGQESYPVHESATVVAAGQLATVSDSDREARP